MMNKQQEYLVLDALNRQIVTDEEQDLALRALAGNAVAQERIIPVLTARRRSGYTPRPVYTPRNKDENFDYTTGGDSGLRALMSVSYTHLRAHET